MEKGYNEKMVSQQILRVREHSKKDILEREKTETADQELTFNKTYYPVFQDVSIILQGLHLLLAPDKEHKKAFSDIAIFGLQRRKDYLVRRALPKTNETERCRSCGKKTL